MLETLSILDRTESGADGTFSSEILTCRFPDGSVRRMIAKRGGVNPSHGHRGGPPYEAEVYRRVLQPLQLKTPRFYADRINVTTGETTLYIEYLENAERASRAGYEAMRSAARWIGTFHRLNEARVELLSDFLKVYDSAYYLGWVDRMLASSLSLDEPWLHAVCEGFRRSVPELLSGPLTIVHGEYYPRNILACGRAISPVDWESAAVAAGEIDVATLSEGWSQIDKKTFVTEYRRSRWPQTEAKDFERRVIVGELYAWFRWFGERRAVPNQREREFERLRQLGQALGVI